MPFTATRTVLAILLSASLASGAKCAPGDHPPRYLQEPVLGIRLQMEGLKLAPLPENIRALCGQIADDETWMGRMWILAEAEDATTSYYVLAGYFKRRHPGPRLPLYDTGSQGGFYIIRQNKCGGDPARDTFDVRDFEQTPQAVLQQLAHDLAAKLIRALGGADRLRSEIRNQHIDFEQLSPELQGAFAPYFEE